MITKSEDIDTIFRLALTKILSEKGWGAKAETARKAGVSNAYIIEILKGRRAGTERVKRIIAASLGFSYEELLNIGRGKQPPARWHSIQPVIKLVGPMEKAIDSKKIRMEDYYAAPLVAGKIAAGPGILPDEEVKSLVWIYSPELRSRQSHQLVAIQLDRLAESMKPTLFPDDIILIDRDDPKSVMDFQSGKIYAIRTDRTLAECAVKRLYANDKGIIISSDNRNFPPEAAWTNDLERLVVGRVVWGWRSFLDM